MHPATPGVAAAVRAADGLAGQLDALRGAYAGATAVVVTCGPSLAAIDPERLRDGLRSAFVIAVKQANDVVGPVADMLCFNTFNVSRYRRHRPETLWFLNREPTGTIPQLNPADVVFDLTDRTGDLGASLAATRRFDDFLLDVTPVRPWGPGILYESALYLAVHVGASRVVAVGWDIANARGNNVHFWDDRGEEAFFDAGREGARRLQATRGRLPEPAKVAARWVRALVQHGRGAVYNKTTMLPGEADVVADSTGPLREWLADRGIDLAIVSDRSLVDPSVPRLTPEELYRLVDAER